ncbi:MAG: hypothetical protein RO469_12745 [Thermincola sp.]|jgi:hypothetical protein|nr:hypothetical protein [Thermincola sp.]MDT3701574.1 hypothetical protein [Thermincola sp.]
MLKKEGMGHGRKGTIRYSEGSRGDSGYSDKNVPEKVRETSQGLRTEAKKIAGVLGEITVIKERPSVFFRRPFISSSFPIEALPGKNLLEKLAVPVVGSKLPVLYPFLFSLSFEYGLFLL